MKSLRYYLFLIPYFLSIGFSNGQNLKQKPNVIIIVTDDQDG
ncbi:MAG: hypothetical protein ACOC10_06440 [Bacteroidota bacterium]